MSEPVIPDAKVAVTADEAFLRQVRADLDRSCSALDGHTLSCLNRIRHAALERKTVRRRTSALLLPFGGVVTAAVLVLSVMLNDAVQPPEALPGAAEQLEDMDLLSASEDLDFYEELDFYQWLADGSI